MDPAQEPFDPYVLHPSDHPALILVTRTLQDDKYASWSLSMRMALNAKCKFDFVDGSIPKPDPNVDPVLISSWQCNKDVVSSWLLNSVSKEIAASVLYVDLAASIWKELQDRFWQSNGPRFFQLKKDLLNLSQDSLSFTQYYTKLKIIWDELYTNESGGVLAMESSPGGMTNLYANVNNEEGMKEVTTVI